MTSATRSIERDPDPVSTPPLDPAIGRELAAHAPGQIKVIRRNGKVTGFDAGKIALAMTKAFLAVEGGGAAASTRIHERVRTLTTQVVTALTRRVPGGGTVHIEDIQDQVELALMRAGEHKVARSYVLYREEHARERAQRTDAPSGDQGVHMLRDDGSTVPLDRAYLERLVAEACAGLGATDPSAILEAAWYNLFDGVSEADVHQALVMSARALIEQEPAYTRAAARLLLGIMRREALPFIGVGDCVATHGELAEQYGEVFIAYIKRAIDLELLDPRLAQFDLDRLADALVPERDLDFTYLGLQTLYDRYFIHSREGVRFELPQAFFMRVAMGLAIDELEREERAIEFYRLLSSFDFMSSTPTLFNAGTLRPQLSSCYLTTVPDDLDGIYGAIKDNALLQKFAGGLGNDWTRVRGMGAYIKGTNGKSQGVVPFLKVANDTAVAVNQCFAANTRAWTADGPKRIADIGRGDLVLAQRGRYREVLRQFAYDQEDAPMVRVILEHAPAAIEVTAGHPLWALRAAGQGPEWIDAGRLDVGDEVAQVVPSEVVPVRGFSAADARYAGILLGAGEIDDDGVSYRVNLDPHAPAAQFMRDYLAAHHVQFDGHRLNGQLCLRWSVALERLRSGTGEWLTAPQMLPVGTEDLQDARGHTHIARRLRHLPLDQALALVGGMLETAGEHRGGEIVWTGAAGLAECIRYQLLRLGIPTGGHSIQGVREGMADVRLVVPAVEPIASHIKLASAAEPTWRRIANWIFTRVEAVRPMAPVARVYDLLVEGDESYMTTSALAHNGGKRKGAVCAYLETWHIDIEEFLELRKNTGDDRRRTHDMNTANWIPDLFMKRVAEDGEWTLFSPDETPDLHDLTGQAFEAAYTAYEARAQRGEMAVSRTVSALGLWRKMLAMLFETGHPWLAFKDPCNLRYSNQHQGVVHSSNLCTEITLHTDDNEIAVCNLGSINLARHVTEEGLDTVKLAATVTTAMRMLDNVIDCNYYSVSKARRSNLRHRPVGLGIMGFQDALYRLRLPYGSDEAVEFADRSMETVSYYAISASSDLAAERGRYSSFEGSLWSRGFLPIDSIELLEAGRGGYLQVDRSSTLDWDGLRERVRTVGMRNSNCMAIAPTATISNIAGVSQSIEPTYQNLFVKSNLSGEFTVINPHLVEDLKTLGLWDAVMINDLKYYDGSVQRIDRIPPELKALYSTAFEIDPRWLVEAAARRQKWLDQAQSLNLYMSEPSGKKLDNLYKLAWVRGLKTTYYLRSMGATHVEKSTMADAERANRLNAVVNPLDALEHAPTDGPGNGSGTAVCDLSDDTCESCQ